MTHIVYCSALTLVSGSIMPPRKRKEARRNAERKDERIIFRVTKAEQDQLMMEAAGKTTISQLIHSRLFGAGMRNHDALRQVAALHSVGMTLRKLSEDPSAPRDEVRAVLAEARAAIAAIAKQLP